MKALCQLVDLAVRGLGWLTVIVLVGDWINHRPRPTSPLGDGPITRPAETSEP